MALVPGRARILHALRNQRVRSDLRTRTIDCAISRRRISRIAPRITWRRPIQWGQPVRRVELRQAIKRSIRESVRLPIRAQLSEIVVQRTVLLRHKDNVIQRSQTLRLIGRSCHRLARIHRHRASSRTLASACGSRVLRRARSAKQCRRHTHQREEISSSHSTPQLLEFRG